MGAEMAPKNGNESEYYRKQIRHAESVVKKSWE